jgi:DNA gyrase subunit B
MAQKQNKQQQKGGHYEASDITVLEGLEPVRKRPGMYIGTTGTEGLHHLIWEVFDNSRDEAMQEYADDIEIALLPDGSVRVADNGRGIPVDTHKQTKVSALETIMTTLHAGGKFGGEGYKVSGGLHGVGVSVVNALSNFMRAEVHRDGGRFVQEYQRGKRADDIQKVGTSDRTGTIITFRPDEEIFKNIQFDWSKVTQHMRQQAYLVRGLRITVIDAREVEQSVIDNADAFYLRTLDINASSMAYYFEGGLRSLVKYYNELQKPLHKSVFHIDKETEEIRVEIALQYVDDMSSRIFGFANNIYNPEGGMHVTGFKTVLTRTLNNYARKNNLLKENEDNFSGDDVLEGLTAVVSVMVPSDKIQFEGQTKAKLGTVEARSAVETVFSEAFATYLEENPDDAKAIINKAQLALKARKAAKAAKDSVLRKGALEGMTLPGKLADCQTKKAEESELFIVEGDSAGGSAKMGRDRRTQAILPLRGKILNVERARLDRMLNSAEIKALVIALGTGVGDTFDIEKLRYHKVIIATDADVDGAHIRTLLLTLFYRYFREIIDDGYLYMAQPPLYKVKQGKESWYAYSEEEKNEIVKARGGDVREIEEVEEGEATTEEAAEQEGVQDEEEAEQAASSKGKGKKISISRYKGLGEMNPEELWETTMNEEGRVLKQVTIEDAQGADRIFDQLMGTDVTSRKSFIQSHAKEANIDL